MLKLIAAKEAEPVALNKSMPIALNDHVVKVMAAYDKELMAAATYSTEI
jgi:hypothetical protein